MLRFWHFLTVLGLALAVAIAPAQALERSVGGTLSKNSKVDVQIETIRTFIESIKTRLDVDLTRELGYETIKCGTLRPPSGTGDCRIYWELKDLQDWLDRLEARFNAIDRNKVRGLEVDPYTCAYAREVTPSCNLANQRLVWNGSDWQCQNKAAWETGGAGACATATIPAPPGCSEVLLRNCCDRWICGGSC